MRTHAGERYTCETCACQVTTKVKILRLVELTIGREFNIAIVSGYAAVSKLPFPVIKLLNTCILNLPEFNFKQFVTHSYSHYIVVVGSMYL